MQKYKTLLSIAGSDSGGGAGIQADIKAGSACGCFVMTAITAITVQNTLGVSNIHPIPVNIVEEQIRACLDDIGADAVKIGMLHSSELIRAVVRVLKDYPIKNLVVDPVMVATSGDKLLMDEAIQTLKTELLPMATMITPNIPEAEILANRKIKNFSDFRETILLLADIGSQAVLLKGGHLEGDEVKDILFITNEKQIFTYSDTFIETQNTHGTGCTLSSALAAFLARGFSLPEATKMAHDYVHNAIFYGKDWKTGEGHGAVRHFYEFWK